VLYERPPHLGKDEEEKRNISKDPDGYNESGDPYIIYKPPARITERLKKRLRKVEVDNKIVKSQFLKVTKNINIDKNIIDIIYFFRKIELLYVTTRMKDVSEINRINYNAKRISNPFVVVKDKNVDFIPMMLEKIKTLQENLKTISEKNIDFLEFPPEEEDNRYTDLERADIMREMKKWVKYENDIVLDEYMKVLRDFNNTTVEDRKEIHLAFTSMDDGNESIITQTTVNSLFFYATAGNFVKDHKAYLKGERDINKHFYEVLNLSKLLDEPIMSLAENGIFMEKPDSCIVYLLKLAPTETDYF